MGQGTKCWLSISLDIYSFINDIEGAKEISSYNLSFVYDDDIKLMPRGEPKLIGGQYQKPYIEEFDTSNDELGDFKCRKEHYIMSGHMINEEYFFDHIIAIMDYNSRGIIKTNVSKFYRERIVKYQAIVDELNNSN